MNPNPLQSVKINFWYQVLMVAGITIFIINGLGLFTAYPTDVVAFISLGFFFWGLGEWVNHPIQEVIIPATYLTPALKGTSYPRNPKSIGIFFDIISVILFIIGIVRLVIKLF